MSAPTPPMPPGDRAPKIHGKWIVLVFALVFFPAVYWGLPRLLVFWSQR